MAADVAFWHSIDDDLHDDTAVHFDLPKPWEVLLGEARCTRAQITEVCRRHGIDPIATGWAAARPRTRVERVTPTPELVHGVTVNHPELAAWLRRIGAFSGSDLRWPAQSDISV